MMIQVKNDFFMREAQDIVLLTTSNRTNELFVLDGSQSRQDLINAWNLFTSFKEFKETGDNLQKKPLPGSRFRD